MKFLNTFINKTSLHAAVENENLEILELLLKEQIDINARFI